MMYPRLKVARSLLREDGVIFISIDESEYSHLRDICAELFGEENLIGTVVWRNATDNNPTQIATEHEYLLVVGRSRDAVEAVWKSSVSDIKELLVRVGRELAEKFSGEKLSEEYERWYREHKAELWPLDRYKYIDEGGVYTGSQSVHNPGREGYRYDVIHPRTQKPCKQPLMGYRFPPHTMRDLVASGKILFGEDETKLIELKVYAHEYEEKLPSVIELDGRLGAYDLKTDFPVEGKVFSNPKPVRLLTTFFPLILRKDGDTVLDFFAGSGSTAKAVLALNAKDGVKRRFILVQLPEPLSPEDKEQRAAVTLCDKLGARRTIAEVTKERLRRASAGVMNEDPSYSGDRGFRVFKLDSSNIRSWERYRDDIERTLLEAVEHLKRGRTESDVLYELLLKLGLDLCVPIESRKVYGHTIHSVGGGVLMACLSEQIGREQVEHLAQAMVEWRAALMPGGDSTCVFRDSAFADDVAKTNMAAILEQHGIVTVRSL
jgi:adenine-specific DNA-methyltransferase